MNIYIRELKAHRKSLIIWCAAMIFLIIASMGKYSAGAGAGAGSFNEIMGKMPESLQNLFGVGVFDLSKALDYIGVLFLYIALVAVIHAAMLGSGIISKEEQDKTVEFLMTKPVSRQQIITSKLLSALTIILVLNVVTYVTTFSMLSYFSKDEPFAANLFKLMLALFALQLLFTALGAFCAALISRPKLSSAIATGILMLMFMLSIIVDIAGNVDFLRFYTLFKYYDAKDILKRGYDIVYPIISVVLLVVLTSGTYYFYKKRDLRA